MKLHLAHDWKALVRHAWSLRFLAMALVCEGLQLALPYLPAFLALPPTLVSATMGLLVLAAGFARLVPQKALEAPAGPQVSWRDGDLLVFDGRLFRAVQPEGVGA